MAPSTNVKPPVEMTSEEETWVCKSMNTLTFLDSLKVIKGRLEGQVHSNKDHNYAELRWFNKQNRFKITEAPRSMKLAMDIEPEVSMSRVDNVDNTFLGTMSQVKFQRKYFDCRKLMLTTNTKFPEESDDFGIVNFFTIYLWVNQEENKWIELRQSLARITIPLTDFYLKLGVKTPGEMTKYIPSSGNFI